MPKFGQVHFGNNYFSEDTPRGENYKHSWITRKEKQT